MKKRDRIIDFCRGKSSGQLSKPENWRTRLEERANALRGVLADVGYSGTVLLRETDHGLMLIDGNFRGVMLPYQDTPCLVLDVADGKHSPCRRRPIPPKKLSERQPETDWRRFLPKSRRLVKLRPARAHSTGFVEMRQWQTLSPWRGCAVGP